MIEMIPGLPDNVLGLTAIGKVTGEDYESVIVPAIEDKLKRHDKLRMVYHCGPQMEGFTAAAVWDDAKVGLKHLTQWDKIAVVSDEKWILNSVKVFGFLMPCEVQVFENDRLEEAKSWTTS